MELSKMKERAHLIIDLLKPALLSEVVPRMESMLDPFERSLLDAEPEDEENDAEEDRAAAASLLWLQTHEGIPHETIVAE